MLNMVICRPATDYSEIDGLGRVVISHSNAEGGRFSGWRMSQGLCVWRLEPLKHSFVRGLAVDL